MVVVVGSLRVFLARNEIQQDTLDRIKLDGVDERVDANVEISGEKYSRQCAAIKRDSELETIKQTVSVRRCPGYGVQPADEDHGLDDAGLDLVRLVLSGV